MADHGVDARVRHVQQALAADHLDVSATYLAVGQLHELFRSNPELARRSSLESIGNFLVAGAFESQTQSLFLYREAARALAAVLSGSRKPAAGLAAYAALTRVLRSGTGSCRQAAAEAMGSLPVAVAGPRPALPVPMASEPLDWEQLLGIFRLGPCATASVMGRSLVFPAGRSDRVVVVKTAWGSEGRCLLANEVAWMRHLARNNYTGRRRFDIPEPLAVADRYLFELAGPSPVTGGNGSTPCWACVFRVHADYFSYLNDHRPGRRPDPMRFRQDFARNAWLLGKLAGVGIVHSAPIPLFHNRVQRQRRNDGGLYDWSRAGRLDRWLHSTWYPNLGRSGIRDFEHFTIVGSGSRELYRSVGAHLLSCLLLAGSYFRSTEPMKIGFDPNGEPVDCRSNFDRDFLQELLDTLFLHYHKGFVGHAFTGPLPFDRARLAGRMIEKMGRDRHMEEILRPFDQQQMSRPEFLDFLLERGMSEEQANGLKRGAGDITLLTGPHLGGFNQRISVPELIEFVTVASALCIGGKYVCCKYGWSATAGDSPDPGRAFMA